MLRETIESKDKGDMMKLFASSTGPDDAPPTGAGTVESKTEYLNRLSWKMEKFVIMIFKEPIFELVRNE